MAGQLHTVIEHLRSALGKQDAAGLTDGDLLKRYVRERDEGSFEALVCRHGPMVMGVCLRVLHNLHDAEDAFQATFLVLVRKASALRSPGLLGNWLHGVAYRTALEARKAAIKRRAKEQKVAPKTAMPVDAWADLRPVLDQELERLAEKYRAVIVLCDLQGKTRKEAARQFGCPEGTVASRLGTARTMLAKRLAKRGLALPGGALAGVLSHNVASAGVQTSVLAATIKAASLFAAGQAATGVTSVKVAALTEGVLKAMLVTKLKNATALVLVMSLIGVVWAGIAMLMPMAVATNQLQTKTDEPEKPTSPSRSHLGTGPALAVDLAKIDRTTRKEPAYQSKSPKYCLLVFGPKAETRIWLVLDLVSKPSEADAAKNALYVDRKGNGDLTEPGARVACTMRAQQGYITSFTRKPYVTYVPHFEVGAIVERDGKTRHADLTLDVGTYVQDYRPCSLSMKVNGSRLHSAGGQLLRFADRPQDAPIIHFNGPLTMRVNMETGVLHVPISYDDDSPERRRWIEEHPPSYEERKLIRGGSSSLYAQLGTQGLGRGTFVALSADVVPENVHPVAEIEFPTKDPKKPPLISRVVVKQRRGTLFHDTVRVPEEAVPGNAKVNLSFPDWRGTQVAPATGQVFVENPAKPPSEPQKKE
jgi:RNA polymerase sigma factor (sigma-70 family)